MKNIIENRIIWNRKMKVGYTKNEFNGGKHPVFLEANIKELTRPAKQTTDLKKINKYKTLSISGSSKYFGGQIQDELKDLDLIVPKSRVKQIKNIWKNWHLNDLQAGTELQEQALKKIPSLRRADNYTKAVNYLKKKKLYEDRGYKYGTSWLVKPLPENVEKKIMKLFN